MAERLRATTRPLYGFAPGPNPGIRWRGTVAPDGRFRLQPYRLLGRNTWMPFCEGTPRPDGTGSVVDVSVDVDPLVYGFSVLWLVFMGAGCCGGGLLGLVSLLHRRVEGLLFLLPLLPMIPIFFAITAVGVIESRSAARSRFAELGKLER